MQPGNFRQRNTVCVKCGEKNDGNTKSLHLAMISLTSQGEQWTFVMIQNNHGPYYPSTLSQETTKKIILTKQIN